MNNVPQTQSNSSNQQSQKISQPIGNSPNNQQQPKQQQNPPNSSPGQQTPNYKDINFQNFKKVFNVAENYFDNQEKNFEDKTIDNFSGLDNIYDKITIKDEVKNSLALSSNKIVNFQNFGNLTVDSMELVDSKTDEVCKFAQQVFDKYKQNQQGQKQVTGSESNAKDSKINDMKNNIQKIVKYDLDRSTEGPIQALRSVYAIDNNIKVLNQLEGFLISDEVKNKGYNYTPRSIIQLVINMVKLAKNVESEQSSQLSSEEISARNEIFKILYDTLIKQVDSKIIVLYIESTNNTQAFTDYCNNQNPSFNFADEVTKYQKIAQGAAQINNNKTPVIPQPNNSTQQPTPTNPTTQPANQTGSTQELDEIKNNINTFLNNNGWKTYLKWDNETVDSLVNKDNNYWNNLISTIDSTKYPNTINKIKSIQTKLNNYINNNSSNSTTS